MKYSEFLMTATDAAQIAGSYILQMSGKVHDIHYKGEIDLVTEVDLKSEQIIIDLLQTRFPDHSILSEEAGKHDTQSDYKWIIDPLDGTTNFAHGFPCYCISIGLEYKGEIIVGVVNDVSRNELFFASKGSGAFLNNRQIQVSKVDRLIKGLLATGFPYAIRDGITTNIPHFTQFLLNAQAVRRPGSAAIDLCQVACGRFDGFWEYGLNPWDVAAGKLIVEEAGGKVSKYNGDTYDIYFLETLASNGLIHQEMTHILLNTPR